MQPLSSEGLGSPYTITGKPQLISWNRYIVIFNFVGLMRFYKTTVVGLWTKFETLYMTKSLTN
jgi:hypothetical protein